MRYQLAFAAVALVVLGALGSVVFAPAEEPEAQKPPDDRLLRPAEGGNQMWPYTSRSRSIHGRTLAINVVVHGDDDRIHRALTRRSEANWTGIDEGEGDVEAEIDADAIGDSPWGQARGANRYTYFTGQAVSGFWSASQYQLATGDYLGRRIHIRAYPAPSADWTAFQAHVEYWDWFRLRHTVTDVPEGARFVERDLRNEPFVDGVSREYHGFTGGGTDGWLTVIRFTPVLGAIVVGAAVPAARLRRIHLYEAAIPVALAGIVLGVRSAGLALEAFFPDVNPKVFAAFLYPFLAVGPLVAVRALGPRCTPNRTALLATVGFGAGIVMDMLGVGVNTIPVVTAVHRVALAAALGVVTLGVARGDRATAVTGVAAWAAVLAAPLIGFV